MTVAMTHSKAMQQQTKNNLLPKRRNSRDARKINGIASTRTTAARKTAAEKAPPITREDNYNKDSTYGIHNQSNCNEDDNEDNDIGSISIKGLRNMARTLNINIHDCIEKRE